MFSVVFSAAKVDAPYYKPFKQIFHLCYNHCNKLFHAQKVLSLQAVTFIAPKDFSRQAVCFSKKKHYFCFTFDSADCQ